MSKFTVFVGGIHGAGKGCFSQLLRQDIDCEYVSASSLLNWTNISKEVKNVDANQHLLSILLSKTIKADKVFLIDGHFALWNQEGGTEAVSHEVFLACKPNVLVVVVENSVIIAKRLKERDGVDYEIKQLERLQFVELENARSVAELLGVKMFVVHSTDDIRIRDTIKEIVNLYLDKTDK